MSGLTLGANTFSYIYRRAMLDTVRHLATFGYREFEILVSQPHFWAADLGPAERRDIPKMLSHEGLRITSVNLPGIDNNLVSSTREMRAFTVDVLCDLIDLCGDWRIPYCILVPGRTMPLWPIPKPQLTEWFAAGMTTLANRAGAQGVTLLVENVPNTWIPRAADVMEVLDALGRDDVGVIYDVANAPFAGEDPREGLREVRSRLRLVHLSDTPRDAWRHDPVGTGDVPFAEILAILRDVGYRGTCMLELITADPDFHFVDSRAKLVAMGWDDFAQTPAGPDPANRTSLRATPTLTPRG